MENNFGNIQIVTYPDNKLRQEVWVNTYFKALAEGYRISHAMKTADLIMSHFDEKFTTKKILN